MEENKKKKGGEGRRDREEEEEGEGEERKKSRISALKLPRSDFTWLSSVGGISVHFEMSGKS